MGAAFQWFVVVAVVVAAGAYAARALMPPTWRRGLAGRLRARGNERLAARFDGGGGCDTCPGNAAGRARRH